YVTNSFGQGEAILSYVKYDSTADAIDPGNGREGPAVEAGIWFADETVSTPDAGITTGGELIGAGNWAIVL
ncbi:MAG: hypothetical protein AAF658_10150, partial [Myxococcota bacterium]